MGSLKKKGYSVAHSVPHKATPKGTKPMPMRRSTKSKRLWYYTAELKLKAENRRLRRADSNARE